MTRLYGFTRDYHFPYYCFGKKCFGFKIIWSPVYKKFKIYFFKLSSDSVLHAITNRKTIKFFGFIKTDFDTLYDLFND